MIRVKYIKGWSPPKSKMKLDVEVYREIGKVALASVIDNIVRQVQSDGSPLKHNAPSTRARKMAAGLGSRSLVAEEHRFTRPSSWRVDATATACEVSPRAVLGDLSRHVQRAGYVGWFAVGADGLAAIKRVVSDWISKRLRSR